MKQKLKIVVDLESTNFAGSAIFGPIHVDFNYIKFPNENWDDFLFVVTDWLHQLSQFSENSDEKLKLSFADGQAQIILSRSETSFIDIRCEHTYGQAGVPKWPFVARCEYEINQVFTLDDFRYELESVCELVLNYAKKHHVNHSDLELFEKLVKNKAN